MAAGVGDRGQSANRREPETAERLPYVKRVPGYSGGMWHFTESSLLLVYWEVLFPVLKPRGIEKNAVLLTLKCKIKSLLQEQDNGLF